MLWYLARGKYILLEMCEVIYHQLQISASKAAKMKSETQCNSCLNATENITATLSAYYKYSYLLHFHIFLLYFDKFWLFTSKQISIPFHFFLCACQVVSALLTSYDYYYYSEMYSIVGFWGTKAIR